MKILNLAVSKSSEEHGFKLNQDLVKQINEMSGGDRFDTMPSNESRPLLVEGFIWSIFGAALWILTLYIAS
ncbi:hypothetical protein [Paraburkholderia fungorum]|uniref:hypothetical protein n=1 Tax=Paraburkholderia fungorum TaxID=134537 RepID=UPI0009434D27|nr:hypothetical protein [Paraburkholderia fungorum]